MSLGQSSNARKVLSHHLAFLAINQLSLGFLDGGDRTTVLSSSGPTGPSGFESDPWDVSPSDSTGLLTPPEPQGPSPSPTLLVTNLPTVLFSDAVDLRPLLCPFGEITSLKIINDAMSADQGNISVVVEYKTLSQAQDARDNLSGQVYANSPVQAEFLLPQMPGCMDSALNPWPSAKASRRRVSIPTPPRS